MSQHIEARPEQSMSVGHDQPLIGIPVRENGRSVVRYFADDDSADVAAAAAVTQQALAAIGSWSDLDWDEMIDALARIRHDSTPTPPMVPEL